MIRTVEELRKLIVEQYYFHKDCGELLCHYIHEENMTFKELALHLDITLDELAEVIADHIRKL